MLSAGCPDCKIMLIEYKQSDTDALKMGIGKGVVAASFSYCGTEGSGDLNQLSAWNHPGTGIFASSGDWGYLGHAGVGAARVCTPAAFPGVVSVGGTTLTKSAANPRGWTEAVWNLAGSGCSNVFSKPAWQTDTGCKMRMVADLSAVAQNVSNYCTDPGGGGGWRIVGGTSASSPFVAGALTLMGAIGSDFTPEWVWQHASDFYDVTSGNNGTCGGSPAYYCQAAPGYDAPTGVGTPNGVLLGGGFDGGPPDLDSGGPSVDASIEGGSGGGAGVTTGGTGTGGTGNGGAGGSTGGSATTTSSSVSTTGTTTSSTGVTGSGGAPGRTTKAPADDQLSGCACHVTTRAADADSKFNSNHWSVLFAALSLLRRRSQRVLRRRNDLDTTGLSLISHISRYRKKSLIEEHGSR
jgi:hypothetical protein